MGTVRQRAPTGVTYVYETTRYWDEVQQKYRVKKKSLGKLDPDTGELIPANDKHGPRPKQRAETDLRETRRLKALYEEAAKRVTVLREHVKKIEKELAEQNKRVRELTRQNNQFRTVFGVIRALIVGKP